MKFYAEPKHIYSDEEFKRINKCLQTIYDSEFLINKKEVAKVQKFSIAYNDSSESYVDGTWRIDDNTNDFQMHLMRSYTYYTVAGGVNGNFGYGTGRSGSSRTIYLYGHVKIPFQKYRSRIMPETLLRKLKVTFLKFQDIDLNNHKRFSDRYIVQGIEEEATKDFFSSELIEILEKYKGLHLEVFENDLLFRLEKSLDEQEAWLTAQLGLILDKFFNG